MTSGQAIAPTVENEQQFIILGGNTLKANSLPYFPLQISTLGSLTKEVVPSIVVKVIQCESGWNQSAIGLAGEIGIAQFMPTTWIYFNKLRGTNLDIHNGADQLDMIIWAFNAGYANHWTCYRKLTYEKVLP